MRGLRRRAHDGTERRALELVHEEMRALIHIGDPQRFHEVNEAFHGAIYAGAHNAYLAEMTLATRRACSRSAARSSARWAGWRARTWSTTGW